MPSENPSLFDLRNTLTDNQRLVLKAIWRAAGPGHEWPLTRVVHREFGKSRVREAQSAQPLAAEDDTAI